MTMSTRTLFLPNDLHQYLCSETLNETELLADLRAETAQLPQAIMQISPEQGQFMRLLIGLTGARKVLEVGTFTGYSSLCMALAMPADGKIVALDVSEEWTSIARRYWAAAGVAEKIDLRLAPALETLPTLADEFGTDSFDFAFLDAVKTEYDDYYEAVLPLLRAGGLIAIDNALQHGAVSDPEDKSPSVQSLRELNRKVTNDERVVSSLVPIGDGLLLAQKK